MAGVGVIFDMDGTLWDSSQEVADSWSRVLKRHPEAGRTVTRSDIQAVMGMPMTDIARTLFAGLPEGQQMALLDECTSYENEYLAARGGGLYPGLTSALDALAGDYTLLIVSNCQSGYIEAFLEHYDFGRYFAGHLCFGDNGLAKAANIREIARRFDLEEYYYVGDIQADYDAAAKAGAHFIHAAYGYGTIREPVPRLTAITELPQLLHTLRRKEK